MIQTREAHTDDEAWMIELLNKEDEEIDRFNPREFLLAVDDETEERFAFGRTEYIRNVDDTEYVEINNVIVLDRAEDEHGEQLVVDLVGNLSREDRNQVFAFPHDSVNVFRSVGFSEIEFDKLPTVMQERYEEEVERHGDDVMSMMALPSKVEIEEEDDEDEYEKPNGVTDKEVEQIKEDLDIKEDTDTKYSV